MMHTFLEAGLLTSDVDRTALDYAVRDQEIADLGLFDLYETKEDVDAFLGRFVDILDGSTVVSPLMRHYLETEGLDYFDGTPLDARHLLFWLDRVLKRNKVAIGYADRLSEADEVTETWGAVNPDTLADADPFGLVDVLEGLGWNVVVVDYDAADDEDAGTTDGCVRILRTSTVGANSGDITTIGLTPKTDTGLFDGSGDVKYRLWKELGDFHERGGGGRRCKNSTTAKVAFLIRNSAAAHVVKTENIVGVRVETQTVTITGSPGSGTFTLTSPDYGTTGDINYDATAADVQAALRAVAGLENVTVSGTNPAFTVQFHRVSVANPATLTSTPSFDQGSVSHGTTQTGDAQVDTLLWTGYPGEVPEIWCGNSTDDPTDASPTECPNSGDTVKNGTSSIFVNGTAANKYRDNFHVRNMKFHGKRETDGGDFIYCGGGVLNFAVGKNCSVRHCIGVDLQPLPDDDFNVTQFPGTFDAVVDFANSVRNTSPSTTNFGFVQASDSGFVFDSNYCEGVDLDDYPNASNSAIATISTSDDNGGSVRFNFTGAHGLTSGKFSVSGHSGFTGNSRLGEFTIASVTSTTITTTASTGVGTGGTGGTIRVRANSGLVDGFFIDIGAGGDNCRVTRNRLVGLKVGGGIRVKDVDGAVVDDNISESYDGSSIFLAGLTNFYVRRNRIGPHGAADYALETASHGIQCGYSSDGTISDNVIYGTEPTSNVASYGIWFKGKASEVVLANITVERNLFYRDGIFFDDDGADQAFANIVWQNNIFAGFAEVNKNKNDSGAYRLNAPIMVNLRDVTGDAPGTLNGMITIDGNYVWRFANATPDQSTIESGPHLGIRNNAAPDDSTYYEVDDALTGWTNNVAQKPNWAADPETGDFTLSTDPVGFSAGTPFTATLSRAWTP